MDGCGWLVGDSKEGNFVTLIIMSRFDFVDLDCVC